MLTIAYVKAFFERSTQIVIPRETRIQLKSKVIDIPEDLEDFDEDSIFNISDNLRIPGGRASDLTPGYVVEATIPITYFIFGAKSQVQILEACYLVRCYDSVRRDATRTNIRCSLLLGTSNINRMP